jgi:hypothetical protein
MQDLTIYTCPVCGFGMHAPPSDFHICPSCGTEFGLHDSGTTFSELRKEWIAVGADWSSKIVKPPSGWNPYVQMLNAGLVHVTVGNTDDFSVRITDQVCEAGENSETVSAAG